MITVRETIPLEDGRVIDRILLKNDEEMLLMVISLARVLSLIFLLPSKTTSATRGYGFTTTDNSTPLPAASASMEMSEKSPKA